MNGLLGILGDEGQDSPLDDALRVAGRTVLGFTEPGTALVEMPACLRNLE